VSRTVADAPVITQLSTRRVAVPFDTVLRTATSGFDAAYLVLVDVTTSDAITGMGWTFAFSLAHLAALEHLVRHVAPAVVGRTAADVGARWADMRAAIERPGVVGSGAMAMAAVDIALWDALGKRTGLPVATLLGGHRQRVESYHSFGLWSDLSTGQLADDARAIEASGATAMKLRVGGRSLAEEVSRVAAVRDAVPEAAVMLDANSAWSPKQAAIMCVGFAEHDITWIEDPTSTRRPSAIRSLTESLPIPVCGGEDVYLADGLDVAEQFPFDIAMVDVFRAGGITGYARIAHALALAGRPVTPHLDTPTGIHLVAGLQNGLWVEYLPWWHRLFRSMPTVADGQISVPDEPGLGLAWADDLEQFAV
jgi:L-alanine-DL-glutamate epimerase-like enolase superfamily enzyme